MNIALALMILGAVTAFVLGYVEAEVARVCAAKDAEYRATIRALEKARRLDLAAWEAEQQMWATFRAAGSPDLGDSSEQAPWSG